jgi:hypothetical protein
MNEINLRLRRLERETCRWRAATTVLLAALCWVLLSGQEGVRQLGEVTVTKLTLVDDKGIPLGSWERDDATSASTFYMLPSPTSHGVMLCNAKELCGVMVTSDKFMAKLKATGDSASVEATSVADKKHTACLFTAADKSAIMASYGVPSVIGYAEAKRSVFALRAADGTSSPISR